MYGKRRREEVHLDDKIAHNLSQGLRATGVVIEPHVQEQLLQYIEQMIKWNRAYNLTSVRDPQQIISRHILDSLSILPYLNAEHILDLGTGAGLPGIPLALVLPTTEFVLLDSNGKKCRFLLQTIKELGLDNVSVVKARVEDFRPGYRFDVVVSRAFSSIRDMVLLAEHLCAPTGEFLAMKGTYPAAEMVDIPKHVIIVGEHRLEIPGLDAQRYLIRLKFAKAE